MEQYCSLLKTTPLFAQIDYIDLAQLFTCLDVKTVNVPKDAYALMAGEPVEHIGVVLSGQLQVSREDINGTRMLLTLLDPGEFYAESLCCAGVEYSPVNVVAAADSVVLHLNFKRILTVCSQTCSFHARLIENMLRIIARKNLFLQSRLTILSKRTIRDKILTYLAAQYAQYGKQFLIPFNRNELAEYLAVDRSALSRELGNLQAENLIKFNKNKFELLIVPDQAD